MTVKDFPRTATPDVRDEARTPWSAIAALSVGIFAMTTMEELPIGVMTLMADDLATSNGTIGLGVTIPALLAAMTAFVAPRLLGHLDRRAIFTTALVLMAASGILSSIATSPEFFLASRVFVGLSLGAFWSMLGSTVARMATPKDVARALSIAYAGVSAAVVFGVPLSAALGNLVGWRMSYLLVGMLCALMALTLMIRLPKMPSNEVVRFGDIGRAFSRPGIQFGLIYTLVLVTFHFAAYTYASPLLQSLGGVSLASVSAMLLLYGASGMAGNFLAGIAAGRSMRVTLMMPPVLVLTAMVLFAQAGPDLAILAVILWGMAGGTMPVVGQAWLHQVSGNLYTTAAGLNSSMFNVGIAAGSFLGAKVYLGSFANPSYALVIVVALGMAAVIVLTVTGGVERRYHLRSRLRPQMREELPTHGFGRHGLWRLSARRNRRQYSMAPKAAALTVPGSVEVKEPKAEPVAYDLTATKEYSRRTFCDDTEPADWEQFR